MSLKSKITTKLKEKAKTLGANLSNVRINGLADRLDGLLDNEDDIDVEIDKLDQLLGFKELATLDDAKRNADKKDAEDKDKTKVDPAPTDPAPTDPSDNDKDKDKAPSWFESYTEKQNKTIDLLTSKIENMEKGATVQSRRSTLEAKLKDAPEKFKARALRDFDRLKLETDDDFTNYLADIEQDVADEIQAQSDAGLGGDAPTGGVGGGKLKDDEVSPAMKVIIAERKAAADVAAKTA